MNAIKAGDSEFIRHAIETFKVSRQAIFSHLKSLVNSGYLKPTGNTRARVYVLGPVRNHTAVVPLGGLDESVVYYRDFGFIFDDLPSNIESICHFGFTEMLNNAIDHSGGTFVTIIVKRDSERINIQISDNGVGIFNHIARVFNLSDPRESLFELHKGKLTTDPVNHTGQGIFFTSRAFDRFYIVSDDLIFSHKDGDEDDYLWHNEGKNKGTHILMHINLESDKTLKSVFDDFTGNEEENFVFNKTVVPVKLALYEGEKLISRSQAKRILNRVEKFKKVQLDFKGVDMIGQSFADEIFRVFARRNPHIQLVPVNVTEEVGRTIQAAVKGGD
ncbi:STAS-like domain-containing protein [Nitrosospira sp. Nsp18]|uniref:STAS-like domain-containing protein n=1 Tax=Nitrosospira sp. Nsp18 TaxID=1855334 RepID=UPI0015A16A81|nr:STAS-like domain-containing protein [Nitrosospira sp. Nsp18]